MLELIARPEMRLFTNAASGGLKTTPVCWHSEGPIFIFRTVTPTLLKSVLVVHYIESIKILIKMRISLLLVVKLSKS